MSRTFTFVRRSAPSPVSTHPSRPLRSAGDGTPAQRPRRAATESVVGEPNALRSLSSAITRPPGRLRRATVRPPRTDSTSVGGRAA